MGSARKNTSKRNEKVIGICASQGDSCAHCRKSILVDFLRHGFDGSGADNFFDAGKHPPPSPPNTHGFPLWAIYAHSWHGDLWRLIDFVIPPDCCCGTILRKSTEAAHQPRPLGWWSSNPHKPRRISPHWYCLSCVSTTMAEQSMALRRVMHRWPADFPLELGLPHREEALLQPVKAGWVHRLRWGLPEVISVLLCESDWVSFRPS